jgi:hypothetical protein
MHNQDENSLSEKYSFTNSDKLYVPPPERHGSVTAWLILIIVINCVTLLMYILLPNKILLTAKMSYDTHLELLFLGALNIVFSIMLMRWRKIGFYGFGVTAIIGFVLNVSSGISLIASILGLSGVAILYGILQIKKNGRSAWSNLK